LLTAFISDIHANLPALEAAVEDAKKRGVSQFFCAGDITGYGPFPDEVCDYLQESHIKAVAGNYDAKVLVVLNEGHLPSQIYKRRSRKFCFGRQPISVNAPRTTWQASPTGSAWIFPGLRRSWWYTARPWITTMTFIPASPTGVYSLKLAIPRLISWSAGIPTSRL
jgi:Icc-related predicted phosphoesterase